MSKLTYKNVTRFSIPVVVKTTDGAKTVSFNLPPQQTVDLFDIQITGDVRVKTKNGLLKLVSEEVDSGTKTEFLKVQKPVQSSPKVSISHNSKRSSKEKD